MKLQKNSNRIFQNEANHTGQPTTIASSRQITEIIEGTMLSMYGMKRDASGKWVKDGESA